jgi:hypothetical protein
MVVLIKPPLDMCHPHRPTKPPPPPPKPLTTLGGVRNTAFPKKKKPFFPNFTLFCLFSMSFSGGDSGKMKMDFQNPRDFFSHHGLKNKNLSHFFHKCHEKGESKPSSRPIFFIFHSSVIVLILRELLWRDGSKFGETKGGFCP